MTTTTAGTTAGLRADLGYVTDGGMETDLIFHHGVDLPHFAAFPLLQDADGRELLTDYYAGYAAVATRAGAGLLLESATWRANPDWGARLGYDAAALAAANEAAIALLRVLRNRYTADVTDVRISGMIGPRGDGYAAGERADPAEAAAYHRPQIEVFAAAGVDVVTALTLTDPGEAIGIVLAAREVGVPVAVAFTVETDGRLPGGTRVAAAIREVDAAAVPDRFLLNCAHPDHVAAALADDTAALARVTGLRHNASRRSHAELDEATELDEGDPANLARAHTRLVAHLPGLRILGGCCGTDARHVAHLWGVPPD